MKAFMMIVGVMLCADVCIAETLMAVEEPVPGWLNWLVGRIPAESIAWIMAFFGLLNGLSVALEKIDKALTAYADKTKGEGDDRIAAIFHTLTVSLANFLKFTRGFVDFFTAKRSVKK